MKRKVTQLKLLNKVASVIKANCPNLVELAGWNSSLCRERLAEPGFLPSSEVKEYCEKGNFDKCAFYTAQS